MPRAARPRGIGQTSTVEQLAAGVAGAMPDLNATDRRIAVTLYQLLAEGNPSHWTLLPNV